MFPAPLQQLAEHFEKFPGIGPRQARRFALFIMKQTDEDSQNLADVLREVKNTVILCTDCYLPTYKKEGGMCEICLDTKRDQNTVMIVERESDALNLEKINMHQGIYFVLGGNISALEKSNMAKERLLQFMRKLKKNTREHEVVLALNNTREGNFTALYIQELFKKNDLAHIKLTRLGRGLATGNEIEYLDEQTLRSALEGRK